MARRPPDRSVTARRVAAALSVPDRVLISVEVSGRGVAKDVGVFRLLETTTAAGSGLGLAVPRQTAMAHGGGTTFAFLTPHGTVFRVDLP